MMPSMSGSSHNDPAPLATDADREIVYVADPMCSWCWGFAPVIRAIAERYAGRLPVRLVPGGLRVGDHTAFDADFKARLREHWRHVEAETGQGFDYAFFERPSFNYNTEPACRAVVVAQHLDAPRALAYLEALQSAFYESNRDITDPDVLTTIAADCALDASRFGELWRTPALREETFEGFKQARRLGARGFPTVLLRHGDHFDLLTSGYQPSGRLMAQVEDWLHGRPASLNLF